MKIAPKKGIPLVATFHSKFRDDLEIHFSSKYIVDYLIKNIIKFYESADEVWIPQSKVEETIRSYGYKGSLEVVENGIDINPAIDISKFRNESRQILGFNPDEFVLLYVGQHIWEKNLKFLIESLRLSPIQNFKALFVGEGFRKGMIAAYRKMAELMPVNGIQVIMFTHQSGSIWADMANIIWASGMQVTAAWYVVTETNSALRQGANVTGTIMLVLRKRHQRLETYRDELGWKIEDAVRDQVESLVGLDKSIRAQGSEGLYSDADLQMAGYAAALKVLTKYSVIDGKEMVTEAEAPRVKGKKTFVDELIEFAVTTAVQFLVPVGFEKSEWLNLAPVERFYLKMAEMEHQGNKTLDNYINFAKAFKIRHFDQLMSDTSKANSARLKLSSEFIGSMMSGDTEIARTPLRALLYAMYEISRDTKVDDVLLHLMENCPNYLQVKSLIAKMADYIAEKRGSLKPTKTFAPDIEASSARIMADAIRNQRL